MVDLEVIFGLFFWICGLCCDFLGLIMGVGGVGGLGAECLAVCPGGLLNLSAVLHLGTPYIVSI